MSEMSSGRCIVVIMSSLKRVSIVYDTSSSSETRYSHIGASHFHTVNFSGSGISNALLSTIRYRFAFNTTFSIDMSSGK